MIIKRIPPYLRWPLYPEAPSILYNSVELEMVNPTRNNSGKSGQLKAPPVLRRLATAVLLLTALLLVVSLVSLSLGQATIPLKVTLQSAAVKLHLASTRAYQRLQPRRYAAG